MTTTDVTVSIEVNDDATWRLRWAAALVCPVCQAYLERRGHVIPLAVAIAAARAALDSADLYRRFVGSVHARHLAGESLSTTPVEVP